MYQKTELTKERIISVARSLFGRFGPRKTTVDEIAAAAGIGKGTIYYHFEAKEEIFLEVVKREVEEWILRLQKTISEYSTPQRQLQAFFVAKLSSLQEFLNLSWLNESVDIASEPRIEKKRDQLVKEEASLIEKILHQGLDQGVFEIEDIKATALHLLTYLKGIEFSWPESLGLNDIETRVDDFLQIVLQGLEARPQGDSAKG